MPCLLQVSSEVQISLSRFSRIDQQDKRVRKHYGSVFNEIHSLKDIYVKSSLSEIDVLLLHSFLNAANRFNAKCDPHLPL